MRDWQEGLVAGNGRSGVICACDPCDEVLTYQNIDFLMPTEEPRTIPASVGEELEEARQAVLRMDDSWDVHGRRRTYLYAFHPGMQLRIRSAESQAEVTERQMKGETGEILLRYRGTRGSVLRRTFVSWEDDCVITQYLSENEGGLPELELSIDAPDTLPRFGKKKKGFGPEINMRWETFWGENGEYLGQIAHYPAYPGSELAEKGYLTIARILHEGGTCCPVQGGEGSSIRIRGARAVWILAKSAAQAELGELDAFPGEEARRAKEELLKKLELVRKKYETEQGGWNYEKALEAQKRIQSGLYGTVDLGLTDGAAQQTDTELLEKQKQQEDILNALAERVYQTGRYVQAACAGYSAPRLCGLWTGEWNPGWSGAYTMDANVNIQISGMNTGHMQAAGWGYIFFLLRQTKDWEKNAEAVYGMHDALLAPVNTDGNRAVMVEYDIDYPFQYWNAGVSWLLVPVFEYWQCFGNTVLELPEDLRKKYGKETLELEGEILRPLLWKAFRFWEQLCTPEYYTDREGKPCYCPGRTALEEGEHYLIIPSYSPENHPLGYTSAITANAAMDIAAARDVIRMLRELEGTELPRCAELENRLPEYQTDETGGLKEWSLPGMRDNHEHRHISHLYCAWPGVETQHDAALAEACRQALRNRDRGNAGKDDTASHGWIHRALVAARLKDGETVGEILRLLFRSDIFYGSLMTDHNTDRSRGVYCTDTILGLQGVVNEALLYSEHGELEFLPALPREWSRGCVRGLMARSGVCVRELRWDLGKRSLEATLLSGRDQELRVICAALGREMSVTLKKGEERQLRIS